MQNNYLVTALVTTYNSERFMRGLLEDLEGQTIADQLEIVIVDSNSAQNERAIVEEFQQRFDNIVYLRTERRESSHAAWNRCIHLARGKYLTIACTDDRHRADALEWMVRVLEENPEIGLVYADSLITNVENETFEHNSATKRYDWPDYNLGTALSSCIFGPQPVWRRQVHEKVGYFDPNLWIAGDHDLFIRIAWHGGAVHLRETLGLFLQRDDSNSGRNHRQEVIQDVLQVMRRFRKQIPIEDIYPHLKLYGEDPLAKAAALWDFGNLCALSPYNDFELAIQNYQKALAQQKLPAESSTKLQTMHLHNMGIVLYCAGEKEKGKDYLMRSLELPAARENLNRLNQLEKNGELAVPTHFNLLELKHPVVTQACRTYGLKLTRKNTLVRTTEHEQVFWDVYVGPNGIPVSKKEKARAIARKPRLQQNKQTKNPINNNQTAQIHVPQSEKVLSIKKSNPHALNILMTMYGWSDAGGGTIHPQQVAKGLAGRGHKVTVIYTAAQLRPEKPAYYVEERHEEGVHLFAVYNRPTLLHDLEFPEREINLPPMRDLVVQIIKQVEPDIVHYQGLVNFSMRIAADVAQLGIPGIYTAYNYWPICPRLYLFENNLTLCSGPSSDGRKCAECMRRPNDRAGYAYRFEQSKKTFNTYINLHLAVSKRVRDLFVQNVFKGLQTEILYQPSATTDWLWETAGKSRRSVPKLKRPLKAGFIGSLLPQKGVHIFISSLQDFSSEQIEGHVFGYGNDNYKASLQKLDKKGLVHFHGRYELEDLPKLLRQVDMVVIPSIWEDCAPFVVQESLAVRCPVIGSRIGGIPEFIEEGKNGFTFEAGDTHALSQQLSRFIQDPTLLRRMQKNIQSPNRFDDYLDKLIQYYHEVISNKSLKEKVRTAGKASPAHDSNSTETHKKKVMQDGNSPTIRQKYSLYHVRGREVILKQWMAPYADLFIGCTNVLDMGCGPGLFLELLRDRGIAGIGFDFDPAMIDICRNKNLKAKIADERALVNTQEEFGGIHLGHIIEHLDGQAMVRLLESCVAALHPGGILLIRTPNWQNKTVRNGGFWLDYSHVRPYPLELLEQIFLDLGLEILKKGYEPSGWNDIYILGKKNGKSSIKKAARIDSNMQSVPAFSIIWEGPQFAYHSLALINRELCLQLMNAGYELSIISNEPAQVSADADERFKKLSERSNVSLTKAPDVHVRHEWPPNLTPPDRGHWVIIQPWEFGSLPKKWAEVFSTQVDELWVPSKYVRQVYIDSGVPAKRVVVIPNGINPDKFHPEVSPYKLRIKKRFKFLFVGGTIHRKGIDLLLSAYLDVFQKSDDVCLIIKDMGGPSIYKSHTINDEIKRLSRGKNAPAIKYINDTLSEDQMAALYTACDVLVHPYRGEGFGLPILEAMACGTPVIVTGVGACLDFCNCENSLLVKAKKIKFTEKKVEYLETVDYPWLYEIDMNDLKKKMVKAYNYPDKIKKLGMRASQEVHNHWTWKHAAEKVQFRIHSLINKPIQRFLNQPSGEIKAPSFFQTAACVDPSLHDNKSNAASAKQIDKMFKNGKSLIENGEIVAGLNLLSKILDLAPQHVPTLKLISNIYKQLGKNSEAQQLMKLANK